MSNSSTNASNTPDPARVRDERRKSRWFVAAALTRSRLERTTLSRVGFSAAISLALTLAVVAAIARASDGSTAPLDGLIDIGAAAIAFVAAAPTTLAAATDRRTIDREDGIEALAAMRGVHVTQLELARTYAAMMHIGRTTAVPLVMLGLTVAALASTGAMALQRLVLTAALVVFSGIVGVVLGSVATLSARVGGRRGKLVVAAVVLLPWIVGNLFGRGIYSIPGALDAALALILEMGSLGVGT